MSLSEEQETDFSLQPEQRLMRQRKYAGQFVMLSSDLLMRSRYLLCITLLLLCHAQMRAQLLTKALPPEVFSQASASLPADAKPRAASDAGAAGAGGAGAGSFAALPDEPSQQLLPVAELEPVTATGVPVRWEALHQARNGDDWTLSGEVVVYYRDYVVHADKVVYNQASATVAAEGHLQLDGGANDVVLTASHGEIHIDQHTAAFYDVVGTMGVRRVGKSQIYSTPDPFLFHGRILLQTSEGSYHIVDGAMTSCRLPRPDWELISHTIEVANNQATARNSVFEFLHVPLFYLPFVRRSLDETGRESGLLIPAFENSGVKGLVFGEQVYWAITRNMDLTVGAEYWSKRGFAPNGDFRYRGPGLDSLLVRWNGLVDRGIWEKIPPATTLTKVRQGGADVEALGRKDLTPELRLAGSVEYLSSYIYRLAFDENLAQATSSEISSEVGLTYSHNGYVPSVSMSRFQSFAGAATGEPVLSVPEVRVLHLPSLRFDSIDRPLDTTGLYWGVGASLADLDRAEPHFHARNVGRLDLFPHMEWPVHLGGWDFRPELAIRETMYTDGQDPDLAGTHFDGVPFLSHNAVFRGDADIRMNVRAPAIERDFALTGWNRELRHVIEPEIYYRYVHGIDLARETLRFDTTDIATDTNEAGFSLTQRFYLKPLVAKKCESAVPCEPPAREWASWQIAQKFYIDPTFGGALISNRRNVFDSTLDLTGVAFLTSPRNIAPIISRVRFEAIDKLRVEWDIDYDTKAGRLGSDNLFAGYSVGRTTFGLGQALLNAADESGSTATLIQSHLLQPFVYFGKPSDGGLSLAMNSSYDFTHGALQYGGVEAIYNWNCCGLTVGYRRFSLGTLRDESEWLWGFTLSSIGSAGNVRRSTSVFPTQEMLKRVY
jgi:LPS-assembly protein